MPVADLPEKPKEKIELVYAFEKNSIDVNYMAGEHLEPIDDFSPSFYNLFIRVFNPNYKAIKSDSKLGNTNP